MIDSNGASFFFRWQAPRTVPPTRHDSADDADASDDAAGPSSSTRRHTTPPKSPRGGAQKPVAPIHVHETPVQVRNIAFRQGLPPGTPATIVRTARRSSARGSGKRGSSIGGGFEGASGFFVFRSEAVHEYRSCLS